MTRRCLATLAAAAAFAVACDVPTEAPLLEQEWQVALDSVTVGTADFLPDGIGLSPDSSRFVVSYPGTAVSVSLASLCGGLCPGTGTLPVKPQFRQTLTATTTLATDLVSAEVAGGSVAMAITHTLEFDPLSPPGATGHGYVVVRVTSDGVLVAQDSIDGADARFTAADTLRPSLELEPATVTGQLGFDVIVYSPAGGPVSVGADDGLKVTLSPGTLQFSGATVPLDTRAFGPYSQTANLDVDSTIVSHVQSGALILSTDNPLAVSGSLVLDFGVADGTIRRTVPLQPGEQQVRVDFTPEQLRSLLSSPDVRITATGTGTSQTGSVTLHPTDRIRVAIELNAVLLIGDTAEVG